MKRPVAVQAKGKWGWVGVFLIKEFPNFTKEVHDFAFRIDVTGQVLTKLFDYRVLHIVPLFHTEKCGNASEVAIWLYPCQ